MKTLFLNFFLTRNVVFSQHSLAATETLYTLNGVFYQSSGTSSAGLNYLSMAGGAPLSIKGSNVASMPQMNQMTFVSQNFKGVEILGPPLSANDEFNSNGVAGNIGYTAPSVMDLFKASYDQFNGLNLPSGVDNVIGFSLKIHDLASKWNVACTQGRNCMMYYSRDYTPILYATTPSNVYKDQLIEFHVNPKLTQNTFGTPADEWPFREIRLGQTLVWYTDGQLNGYVKKSQRYQENKINTIQAIVGDQAPSKESKPALLFYPGYAQNLLVQQTCNFAGDDCWSVRTHPKIESLSESTGYSFGGQNLTIFGWGLNGTDISVLVDNVPCQVLDSKIDKITCVTGQAQQDSKIFQRPGQPGLRRQKIKPTDGKRFGYGYFGFSEGAYPLLETNLMTSFEIYNFKQDSLYQQKLSGWFKAPETAQYRFYVACIDQCQLLLDFQNPFNQSNPQSPKPVEIAYRYGGVAWRRYFHENSAEGGSQKHMSDWISLSKGQSYYIEGLYLDGNLTSEHFTVSVEILLPNGNPQNHPKANPQFQTISIDPVNLPEMWSVVITKPDSGEFQLAFTNPTTNPVSLWTSKPIKAKAQDWEFRAAIEGYFWNNFGGGIDVTRTMYDVNGKITTQISESQSSVYNVTMLKRIKTYSSNSIRVIPKGTNSNIVVTPPQKTQQSSMPLSGAFGIQCTDSNNKKWTTRDIFYNQNIDLIQYQITKDIPFLADKVEVLPSYVYPYAENGVSLLLKFSGFKDDVPPCVIQSGVNRTILGNNLAFNSNITKTFNQTLLFEPIPLEFLSSNDVSAQVLVKVDGLEALCANLTCDYSYFKDQSSYLIDANKTPQSNTVIIQGVFSATNVTKINYQGVPCAVQAQNNQITCELTDTPIAGAWPVQVFNRYGQIPNTQVPLMSAPLNVQSITPNLDLNYLGGDRLVVIGSGFGYNISNIKVTFDTGVDCKVIQAINSAIVCEADKFNNVSRQQNTLNVTITVNGVSDSHLQVSLTTISQAVQSLVPNRVSPVLKQNLTISLASNYAAVLGSLNFNIAISNKKTPNILTNLYLISQDDATKSLVVKFPGAPSGNYSLHVRSEQFGRIDTEQINLTVIGQILDFEPKQGSIFGGTVVTITGENFSDNILDNPVKIGDNYCTVLTSNSTKITCQLPLLANPLTGPQLLLVFLKTSEEAECSMPNGCIFTFQQPAATVTDASVAWDQISRAYIVSVNGFGFDNSIDLVLDGIHQELQQYTSNQASFIIKDLDDTFVTDLEIFTLEGYPEGQGNVSLSSLELTPQILSINPPYGSQGGTKIQVIGSGFGTKTQGLQLIRTDTNSSICQSVDITGYGTFICQTIAGIIPADTVVKVQATQNNASVGVINPNVTYSQTSIFTLQSAQILADNQSAINLTYQGTLDVATCNLKVIFGGVISDSVRIIDSQSLSADYSSFGLPPITGTPTLYCQDLVNPQIGYFADASPTVMLSKPFQITTASSDIVCSWAGGCPITINADGLTAAMRNKTNSITVCGNPCAVDFTLSSASKTVCKVPPLATTYSIQTYKIEQSGTLNATIFPNDPALYDNNLQVDHIDNSTTTCEFGMTFDQGYVGVLDEAKVFINWMTNATIYANNLAFLGSNDNWATSVQLAIIGSDVHAGWNYIDFRDLGANKPAFNSYKFRGAVRGSCRVTEFRLTGVENIADLSANHKCLPVIKVDSIQQSSGSVTYSATSTPLLTSISPRFGSVLGNETVTLTGFNFDANSSIKVYFDNRECRVVNQTSTTIVCITANKPWVPDTPQVQIFSNTQGLFATQGLVFRYVSLWSEPQTWGFDIPPQAGESVSIPKGQHLLVDVDSTPILQAVIVEGSLIFAPDENDHTHLRTFDASVVMVQGGYFEVGTQDFPYTSQLIITMHGDKYSPFLPMYGNKNIAVRYGRLEMWGVTRNVTWSLLSQTAKAGDSFIFIDDYTDWTVGEQIVIPGTVWGNNQTETKHITRVNGTQIFLDSPLAFSHLSVTPNFNGIDMPMRGEVGLLTRNVLFRGDPKTSPINQYGAHIMVSSPGDDSSIGHICYIEMQYVGQAFQLGRYPIHFHMIGNVYESYVIGNAIHDSYNRAVTTHGVHNFRVEENVAYNTMGHSFFIEDAVETNNYYNHNLAVQVRQSKSLLKTDLWPAGFWITHPTNFFTNNHVAGSDSFGFWFDLQEHSTGPSYDVNVCPFGSTLGQFKNNTAHSAVFYGLRIFHGIVPRTYPCQEVINDGDYIKNGKKDRYWQNPVIPAIFEDSVFWRNGKVGAIMEQAGYAIFKNLKNADNGQAGMEWSLAGNCSDGYSKISGGLIVGDAKADDFSSFIRKKSVWGIITPRSENLTIEGVHFTNLDYSNSSAFGSCSKCFFADSTDSDARTITLNKLTFDDATVPIRAKWQEPWKSIYYDIDGSFTNYGPQSWASPYFLHNVQPECYVNLKVYNGIICNNSVQVRRIVYHSPKPNMMGSMMYVARWDDDIAANITSDPQRLFDFQQDVNGNYFTKVEQRLFKDPSDNWAVPFVTGHKYRLHFGSANDFEQMKIEISDKWLPTDKNIHIMTNFTDRREALEVRNNFGKLIKNETYLNKTEDQYLSGDNVIYNQTEKREFYMVFNGKNLANGNHNLTVTSIKGKLVVEETVKLNKTQTLWSDPTSWDSGKIPVQGDDTVIKTGVNMILDISTPLLKSLVINGALTFLQNDTFPLNLTLNSYSVFIHSGGQLKIGNSTNPYNGNATIILYGHPSNQTVSYDPIIYGGNKVLANLGLLAFYGKSRSRNSRLFAPVYIGNTTALVEPNLDWVAGDRLYLAPTATQYDHNDFMTIQSYNNQTGEITFTKPLQFYHWGAPISTAKDYNGVEMRGEVILLTRNVRVVGNDSDSWGGQIVTSDTFDILGNLQAGQLLFNNVEIYNCSQANTERAAIRFENAVTNQHYINNTVVHEGLAWSFYAFQSKYITVINSDFVGARAIGFSMVQSANITVDGIFVGGVVPRPEFKSEGFLDEEACVTICAQKQGGCYNNSFVNSIVAGCRYAGYVVPGHQCGKSETQRFFRNNVAHSVQGYGGGAVFFPEWSVPGSGWCFEGSHFSAYKTEIPGINTQFKAQLVAMTNVTLIDITQGISLSIGVYRPVNLIKLNNAFIYGETQALDCPPEPHQCFCKDKMGFMLFSAVNLTKHAHEMELAHLPIHKNKASSSFQTEVKIDSVTFQNFVSNKTACGAQQVIFNRNPFQWEFVPLHEFTNTKFINVDDSAIAGLDGLDPASQNLNNGCVGFACTGPANVVISHKQVTYDGPAMPRQTPKNFMILSDNPGVTNTIKGCQYKKAWNGWFCQNEQLGLLQISSMDKDNSTRIVSPVYIKNNQTSFINKVNSQANHKWDGFYPKDDHPSFFPSIVVASGNYTVEYSGSVPNVIQYYLQADQGAILVHVPYWGSGNNAGSYQVRVNGQTIPYTPWDKAAGRQSKVTGYKGCGENRFVGVENYLEFWLTAGCLVEVVPANAILCNVRLQWTLQEFYANGGVVSFTDRVAAALGIQAYQIKTVAVYKGSVIINYEITAATDDQSPNITLASIQTKLDDLVKQNNTNVFGAPVLDATTNGKVVASSSDPKGANNIFTNKQTNAPQTVPVVSTPIIQAAPIVIKEKQQQQQMVTTQQSSTDQSPQSQITIQIVVIVIVVLVVVIAIVSAVIYCKNKGKKISSLDLIHNKNKEVEGQADGAQQSEVELHPQFNPDNTTFDIDIFTSKKRPKKMNVDDVVASKYYETSAKKQFTSETKMQINAADVSGEQALRGAVKSV